MMDTADITIVSEWRLPGLDQAAFGMIDPFTRNAITTMCYNDGAGPLEGGTGVNPLLFVEAPDP